MTDWLNRVFLGSCESMDAIPDASIDCCVTSPPYFGLRSYNGEPGMIGLEQTPAEWVDALVRVFREVRRVLRPQGTAWINVGDAYAGSWGAQGHKETPATLSRNSIANHPKRASMTGKIRESHLKPKDLIGLPWRLAFALQADGWYLRSDIIWHKPNPMPSSVTDRPTSSHEHIFLLSKSRRYFYEADAIREPLAESSLARLSQPNYEEQAGSDLANGGAKTNGPMKAVATVRAVDGSVPPANRPSRHGNDIARAKQRLGTPDNPDANEGIDARWSWESRKQRGAPARHGTDGVRESDVASRYLGANARDVWTIATEGFPGEHFAVFPRELARRCILAGSPPDGIVIDPFMGSGTTAEVALGCGRRFTGYEISAKYHDLIRDRLGLFGETA